MADAPGYRFSSHLGRGISGAFGASLVAVLLVGGISLYSAKGILDNSKKVEEESLHLIHLETIETSLQAAVVAVHQEALTQPGGNSEAVAHLFSQMNKTIENYYQMELGRGSHREMERIKRNAAALQETVEKIRTASEKLLAEAAAAGRLNGQALLKLEEKVREAGSIVQASEILIQADITQIMQDSVVRMRFITLLYLIFLIAGSLSILAVHLNVSRGIIKPLKRLAAATQELAQGNYHSRLPVQSRNEIGQLSHSFNIMAEKLEQHEKKLQEQATVVERERLARELHDGLAQSLGYLHMKVKGTSELLAEGDVEKCRHNLKEMERTVAQAHEEVRQALFGLKTMVSKGLGLVPALTEYLHDFSLQTGIVVDLQIQNERATRFSLEAEVQLIRIIQEALANVRKHSGSGWATVNFEMEGHQPGVTIEDGGKGFDLAQVMARTRGQFGLGSMRERAESLGGTLQVDTAPGQGTRVIVKLPNSL